MATERIITGESVSEDEARANWALRPERIEQFVRQRELIERTVYVEFDGEVVKRAWKD